MTGKQLESISLRNKGGQNEKEREGTRGKEKLLEKNGEHSNRGPKILRQSNKTRRKM